jgi:hypothetical protein
MYFNVIFEIQHIFVNSISALRIPVDDHDASNGFTDPLLALEQFRVNRNEYFLVISGLAMPL